jgi:catabolite regulation protein CreA
MTLCDDVTARNEAVSRSGGGALYFKKLQWKRIFDRKSSVFALGIFTNV